MSTAGKILAVVSGILAIVYLLLSSMALELRRNWAERLRQQQQQLESLRQQVDELRDGRAEALQQLAEAQQALRTAVDAYAQSEAHQRLLDAMQRWREAVADPEVAQPQEIEAVAQELVQVHTELAEAANRIETAYNGLLRVVAQLSRTGGGLGIRQIRTIIPLIHDARAMIEAWRADRQHTFQALTSFYENQRLALDRQIRDLNEETQRAQAEIDRLLEQLRPLRELPLGEATLRDELSDQPILKLTARDLEQMPNNRLRELLRDDKPGVENLSFVDHVQALLELMQADMVGLRELVAQRRDALRRAEAETARLLDENRSLVLKVGHLESQVDAKEGRPTVVIAEDGSVPEGEIVEVRDGTFEVVVNVGARDGLRPGVKLHVFRTQPRAEYLGMIEIREVHSEQAVGVILPAYRDLVFRQGDRVAPIITRR